MGQGVQRAACVCGVGSVKAISTIGFLPTKAWSGGLLGRCVPCLACDENEKAQPYPSSSPPFPCLHAIASYDLNLVWS
eukprot:355916-Chlamydomonas_euryale.AAC.2